MNKIKVYSCLFLAFIFTLFAALQYNDPDPEVWIPIYMLVAISCITAIFHPIYKFVLIVLILVFVAGSAYLFPDQYQGVTMPMQQRVPAIEEARESLGLLIAAGAFLWLFFLSYRKESAYNLS
jgi:hypothetical protein